MNLVHLSALFLTMGCDVVVEKVHVDGSISELEGGYLGRINTRRLQDRLRRLLIS